MVTKDEVTARLKSLINASGKEKQQIAKEIGMSKSTISDYLSGRACPTIFILPKICKALDCTYEDILGRI